jgi:hypothetical protein
MIRKRIEWRRAPGPGDDYRVVETVTELDGKSETPAVPEPVFDCSVPAVTPAISRAPAGAPTEIALCMV